MPPAACSTRATWSPAWRPASARSSAAPRSAASRISRTCSDAPAASGDGARRGGCAAAQRLELVGDAPQVLVDGRLVVAAAADGEVAALDGISVHALRIVAQSPTLGRSTVRKADRAVAIAHDQSVALEPGQRALAPLGTSARRAAGSPASSAATIRPRAQRSVSSNRSAPRRRGGGAGPPAARAAQPSRTGQSPQRGARGRQTVAPSSIIAWLKSAARRSRAAARRRAAASAAGRVSVAVEALDHAPRVGVHRRLRAVPRERADRRRRVRPDAGQLGQVVRPAVLGDLPRRGLERERAAVVARGRSRPRARRAGGAAASVCGSGKRARKAS